MNRAFITTVGTSVLSNRDDRPWAGWTRGMALPTPEAASVWLRSSDVAKASAELNTLSKLGIAAGDWVVLLHSDTQEGEWCARVLATFIEERFEAESRLHKITGLGYQGGGNAARALRALSALLLESIREAERNALQPVLCATGGFKSEIAFCNLVGILTGTMVYYIHDQHQELVRLPPLPIREDAQFFKRYGETIAWLEEEPRSRRDAHARLAALPELADLVDEAEDGNVYLNPAASLLYRFFTETSGGPPAPPWPRESQLLPMDKNKVSREGHHRPHGWETIVQKLCDHPYVDSVRYTDFKSEEPIVPTPPSTLLINYRRGDGRMGLLVETTASNPPQLERVANHILRTILR